MSQRTQDILHAVADDLRQDGIEVEFIDRWESRGRPSAPAFDPAGLVCHHTATSRQAKGDYPSLGIVRDGRPDLAGPLAQLGLGRSGKVYIIAAGKANHAGDGGWLGLSGNASVWGIEAENDGIGEPWPAVQFDAYVRLAAALARHTGFGAEMVCGHKEWTPYKIDPAGINMPNFRAQVKNLLTVSAPPANKETYVPGSHFIINPATGLALDVFNENLDDTAPVGLWTCHGGRNQSVILEADGRIRFVHSGKVLDGDPSSDVVHQYTDLGLVNQRWQWNQIGELGVYALVNVGTGRVLTCGGQGGRFRQVAYSGAREQIFARIDL